MHPQTHHARRAFDRQEGELVRDGRHGASAERVITLLAGAVLIFYGAFALVLGADGFGTDAIDGTVNGETWLGIEANGWSAILFAGVGVLLVLASPHTVAAKTAAVVGGLVLGAASVISLVDGDDVFGIFAANGATAFAWGIAALVLLAIGLAPRRAEPIRDPDPMMRRSL